ncbi:MAG: PAS domain S-box protein [Acidimicrobiia bacterium]|jgi:PAS domain S-box-containing protein
MVQIDATEFLLDSYPDALVLCDDSGVILAANGALLDLTGHSLADLLNRSIDRLFPDGLDQTDETSGARGDGSVHVPAEFSSLALTANGDRREVMVAIGNDGGESGRTIIRIRPSMEGLTRSPDESEATFRELLERGALYVVGLDTEGVVNYINPTLSSLVRRSADEVQGRDWFDDFILEDEREWLESVFESVLSDDSAEPYIENSVRVPGGRPRQIRWFNTRLADPGGGTRGTLSVGIDVTDRQRLERRLSASANVASALLGESEIRDVLELVAAGVRDVVWADVAMVLTSDGGRGMVVEAVAGLDADGLVGRELPEGPWENMMDATPHVPSGELGAHVRSLLPWPTGPALVAGLWGRRGHGVLLVANPPAQAAFDAEDLASLSGYAKDSALNIEHALANRRLHHLALVEDRERIARDLHDVVIQDLFSAGMSIDVAMQLIEENEQVETRLAQAVEILNRAISELRGSIFSLRDDSHEDLRTRVMRLVAEATSALGLTPVVRVENASQPLEDQLANHLLATLREALSNVARHSEADEVEVHVLAGPEVKLVVHDDGTGLPDVVPEGRGLSNMAARARELGGEMSVVEPPEGGLRIEWTVPAHGAG